MIYIKIFNICFKPNHFENFNTISLLINHGYLIGHAHNLGKQNRQLFVVTNRHLNITFTTLKSHDNFNEKIYVGSE